MFLGVVGFKLTPFAKKTCKGQASSSTSDEAANKDEDEAQHSETCTQTATATGTDGHNTNVETLTGITGSSDNNEEKRSENLAVV